MRGGTVPASSGGETFINTQQDIMGNTGHPQKQMGRNGRDVSVCQSGGRTLISLVRHVLCPQKSTFIQMLLIIWSFTASLSASNAVWVFFTVIITNELCVLKVINN